MKRRFFTYRVSIAICEPGSETARGTYFGCTTRNPHVRLKEHIRSARKPKCHFHRQLNRAIACDSGGHTMWATEHPSFNSMMAEEEARVAEFWSWGWRGTHCLNTIPGGFAGIRYLHKLGLDAPRDPDQREAFVMSHAARIEAAQRQEEAMRRAIEDPDSWLNQSSRHLTKPVADEIKGLHEMGFPVRELHATHPNFSRSAVHRAAKGTTYQ